MAQITSPGFFVPVDMRQEEGLRKPSKPKLPKKLFAPVWRLPFVLDQYKTRGRRSKLTGDAPGWLQAAIESGLVEMVPHAPGEPWTCGYFEQVDKNMVIPLITEEEIESMILAGLLNMEKK